MAFAWWLKIIITISFKATYAKLRKLAVNYGKVFTRVDLYYGKLRYVFCQKMQEKVYFPQLTS